MSNVTWWVVSFVVCSLDDASFDGSAMCLVNSVVCKCFADSEVGLVVSDVSLVTLGSLCAVSCLLAFVFSFVACFPVELVELGVALSMVLIIELKIVFGVVPECVAEAVVAGGIAEVGVCGGEGLEDPDRLGLLVLRERLPAECLFVVPLGL